MSQAEHHRLFELALGFVKLLLAERCMATMMDTAERGDHDRASTVSHFCLRAQGHRHTHQCPCGVLWAVQGPTP